MIILTSEQAAFLDGKGTGDSILHPALLADGTTWVLPEAVLLDPDYSEFHSYLAPLPTRTVADEEYQQ